MEQSQFSQPPQQGMGQAAGMSHGQHTAPMGHHHVWPMYGPYYAQPMYGPYYAPYYAQQQNNSLFNDRFLKGLLVGAAAAYLLTNETVQRTAIKGAVKAWSLLQGGIEELKERFHDAEAEIRAEQGE